jgi:hypothetical protein
MRSEGEKSEKSGRGKSVVENAIRQECHAARTLCGSFQGMPSGMPFRRQVIEAALAAALPAKAGG